MNKLTDKKLYISVLNVVSCWSVVALHTNGVFWNRPHGRLWITSNFIETFFYFAVPVFFMISGVNLVDYRERYSTKEFLKKRFKKTVIPFILWSVIAGIFISLIRNQPFDFNVRHIIDNIINAKYFSIYWFFPPLFAVYLSMPLIGAVQDKIRIYTYASIVGIILVGIIPLVFNLLHIGSWSITPPIVSGYMIYVLLGYIFDKVYISKDKRMIIYLFGIFGWLLHMGGTLFMSRGLDTINQTFKGYLNIPCMMHTMAIFIFFKYIDYERLLKKGYFRFVSIVSKIAQYTFGIYLLHYFFVMGLPKTMAIETGSLSWRLGGALGIFIICSIITSIIKKVSGLKYLLP